MLISVPRLSGFQYNKYKKYMCNVESTKLNWDQLSIIGAFKSRQNQAQSNYKQCKSKDNSTIRCNWCLMTFTIFVTSCILCSTKESCFWSMKFLNIPWHSLQSLTLGYFVVFSVILFLSQSAFYKDTNEPSTMNTLTKNSCSIP